MREYEQIRSFCMSLSEKQKEDMAEAIAADIFFLDEKLQADVIAMLSEIEMELGNRVREINGFTL